MLMNWNIATVYFTVEHCVLKYKNDIFLSFSATVYIFPELLPSSDFEQTIVNPRTTV